MYVFLCNIKPRQLLLFIFLRKRKKGGKRSWNRSTMEFERRKTETLASMNSPEPDKSPKGNIDTPIIPLLTTLNSHPSYFTTSSCSGRISIFSQPINPSTSKKKAKGGTWLFISHSPAEPTSILPLLFPSPNQESENQEEFQFAADPYSLVFKFEPLIIAVECRDIGAAQSLVSLAISCGFRESGITSVSKRVIIAIRCSIRLEVPLGDTHKIIVSSEYVKYLIELANEKMEANRKRTGFFHEALLRNGFSREASSVGKRIGNDEDSQCSSGGKLESLADSLCSDDEDNNMDGERKDLDDGQSGSSSVPAIKLSVSPILIVGEPMERLFLWGHSACTLGDANHTKILIFGGFGGTGRHARRNDLLLLDAEGGEAKAINVTEGPCPRIGHTSTAVGDSMYVVGGRADPLNILDDVWLFRIGAKEWSRLQCSGQFNPRHRHAAAAVGSKIYIFGGVHNGVILSSLCALDTQNLQWDEIPIQGEWPSPRHSHSMVAYRNDLYMFGGCNGEKALGDLYVFNVQTCKWKTVKVSGRKPTARFSHSMFVYNNYLGIIGGCPVSQHHEELSLLDLCSHFWKHFMMNSTGSDLFVRSSANIVGHELLMIGGGASCYAFGTKFSEPIKIDLLPLISVADNSLCTKNGEKHINSHETGSTEKSNDSFQSSDSPLQLTRNGNLNQNTDVEAFDVSIRHEMVLSHWVLRLERKYAKLGKDILKKFGWLDLARKVCSQEDGKYIYFPVLKSFCTLFKGITSEESSDFHTEHPFGPERLLVKDISESTALNILMGCGATKLEDEVVKVKKAPISPLKVMKEAVASLAKDKGLPAHLLEELPLRLCLFALALWISLSYI